MSSTSSSQVSSLINSEQFKHLLTPAIYDLSHKIQNTSLIEEPQQQQNGGGYKRFLKIENEALEYIGSLILNIFNSILVANFNNIPTPESTCSIAMSCSSTATSLGSESPANTNNTTLTNGSNNNASDSNNNNVNSIKVEPILDLTEAEMRVRRSLPDEYIGKTFSYVCILFTIE